MNELQRWMTENAMSIKLQLLELEKQHNVSCNEHSGVGGIFYIFKKGNIDSTLANYVDGKTFNSNWTELEVRGVTMTHNFEKSVKEALNKIPDTLTESVTLQPHVWKSRKP